MATLHRPGGFITGRRADRCAELEKSTAFPCDGAYLSARDPVGPYEKGRRFGQGGQETKRNKEMRTLNIMPGVEYRIMASTRLIGPDREGCRSPGITQVITKCCVTRGYEKTPAGSRGALNAAYGDGKTSSILPVVW